MKKWIKIAVATVILVLADQLVKVWALNTLKGNPPIELIKGVLELRYIENRGAAFGMLQNQQIFFLIMTTVVILGIIWMISRVPEEKKYMIFRYCLIILGAGALGNMIDRVGRKYVVDLIYFKLIDFPVFNVADIYVTCSMFVLILIIFFYYKDEDLDRIFKSKKAE